MDSCCWRQADVQALPALVDTLDSHWLGVSQWVCNSTVGVASSSCRSFCDPQQAACNSGSSISTRTTIEAAGTFRDQAPSFRRYTLYSCISHAMVHSAASTSRSARQPDQSLKNRQESCGLLQGTAVPAECCETSCLHCRSTPWHSTACQLTCIYPAYKPILLQSSAHK